MAIILIDESVSRNDRIGDDDFELVAGQSLIIETSPGGIEILDEEVPAGKVWTVHVAVVISETDV
jgi:hypothetical protein